MIRWIPWPLLALIVAAGCEEPEPEVPPGLPDPELWAGGDERPDLDHPFFDDHPQLGDLSRYATHVEGPAEDRPDHQHRGAFAVGNGKAFAFLGLADPVNTVHSMVGPTYEKESFFFGDVGVALELDGAAVAFDEEWVARVRGTQVLITRADAGEVSLYTVDFGPHPAGIADLDVPAALVRVVLVTQREDAAHDVVLRLEGFREPELQDGLAVEEIAQDSRYRGYLPWDGAWVVADGDVHLPLGTLEAGDTAGGALVLATGRSTGELHEVEALLAGASVDGWLEDTLHWWLAYSAAGVQLSIGDERIEDLYDGMRTGIRVQQSAAGAVCPMSLYTLMWLRDTIGPVKFYLRAGLHEEARSALDYLYLCAVVEGDYSNACDSGLVPADAGDPPDWDALPPFSGRKAAEGPSYVPLMYREYVAFTGEWEPVQQRWGYLRRALLAQSMEPGGLQPFSGDETFRVAMSAALGHDLTLAYEEETWSANSSLLMAAAAEWMTGAAAEAGQSGDAAALGELEDRARSALADEFLQPEGHYAPFLWRDSGLPETRPFEDVNLKALWTGALAPDDPLAWSNLEGLRGAAGRGDGTVQTALDDQYQGILGYDDIEEGVCTGMVPGYYLSNLAMVGDPESEDAFDALHAYADSAGQYGEYMVYDDLSALSPVYDPAGGLGDYTARHRPWEGGINLDALLRYLVGPLVSVGSDEIVLRPHLPNHHTSLVVTGVRAGPAALSFQLTRTLEALELVVTSAAAEPFAVTLQIPLPAGLWPASAECGGDTPPHQQDGLPGGERLASFPGVTLGPGETVTCTVALTDDPEN